MSRLHKVDSNKKRKINNNNNNDDDEGDGNAADENDAEQKCRVRFGNRVVKKESNWQLEFERRLRRLSKASDELLEEFVDIDDTDGHLSIVDPLVISILGVADISKVSVFCSVVDLHESKRSSCP